MLDKKVHGTDDEIKAEILIKKAKEYLSNKPQIETGYLIHEYIDNYLELCRLKRIKKTTDYLNKAQHIKLLELQRVEDRIPAGIVNEFKKYSIESDITSEDTLDKIIKRVKE